jgi:hypothetical protein
MAVLAKVLMVSNQLERLLYFATSHTTSNRLKVCNGHPARSDLAKFSDGELSLQFCYSEPATGVPRHPATTCRWNCWKLLPLKTVNSLLTNA